MILFFLGLLIGAAVTAYVTTREHKDELTQAYDVGYSDGFWSHENGLRVLPTRVEFYDQGADE